MSAPPAGRMHARAVHERRAPLASLLFGVLPLAALPGPAHAAQQLPTGRAAVEALSYEPLEFEPPEAERHDVSGVRVLLLEEHTLPLVTVFARFRGGYGLFDREYYAPAMGLPELLRYGGTSTLAPDSVDEALELHAIQTSFGSGGGSISSTLNMLSEHLDVAVELWEDMLLRPGFDERQIEVWRGRQLDNVARLRDDPARLAFSTFNRLLYGDHPVGWEMDAADLAPERVTSERFREVHRRIVCRDNLLLGVTGDLTWREAEPLLSRLVDSVPACAEPLPEPPMPAIRREPGVFLLERDLEQAVIVMAHPAAVRLEDHPDFFAATIANAILGAGGFSSRILGRVRTEEGYAYSASSVWTMPRRAEGILGAITRTSPGNTVPAIEAILETMSELRREAPAEVEVRTAVDRIVNGFVFNFDSPAQIVARTMFYLAQDLPEDWLERYWRGVQEVAASDIREAFARHLHPEEMTMLVVGDPDRIGRAALASLGPVTVLDPR